MPDDYAYMTLTTHPTAQRPLLGLTVLVVEDSRFASEAVRLLCIRSGARIRRADSLTAAHRHLRVYRPSVVIVDLGLPDGSGVDLIAELAQEDKAARPVMIATSGADGDGLAEAALAAGAHEFLPKPIASVCAFQQTILKHLPQNMHPTGPRQLNHEIVAPDPIALNEDLSHLDELLGSGLDALPYVAPFLQGLSRLTNDAELAGVSKKLTQAQTSAIGRRDAIQATRDLIQRRLKVRELV
ncbi:response regulator receiver domain-containing protein [Litoreibacter meonggei]|uniref:Response regulator receiver domain-containing protein n=1 Tax=Litoreibacter meonggei TaxID=1049199 RepID=A0A497WUD5_9RHOB|nr:response regulator [Litoreibacter meonggei]RLJ59407.1 response regulator receiver domain-containing protein [Litoreibacter meonggei]